jgi:hypothetical protein
MRYFGWLVHSQVEHRSAVPGQFVFEQLSRREASRWIWIPPCILPQPELDYDMLHEFNPAIVATGYFQQVDHKRAGRHQYGSLPIRIDGSYPPMNRVRPMLREDNHYVFTQIPGLYEAELRRLEQAGVIGSRP